jgi:hypothetical protein
MGEHADVDVVICNIHKIQISFLDIRIYVVFLLTAFERLLSVIRILNNRTFGLSSGLYYDIF